MAVYGVKRSVDQKGTTGSCGSSAAAHLRGFSTLKRSLVSTRRLVAVRPLLRHREVTSGEAPRHGRGACCGGASGPRKAAGLCQLPAHQIGEAIGETEDQVALLAGEGHAHALLVVADLNLSEEAQLLRVCGGRMLFWARSPHSV